MSMLSIASWRKASKSVSPGRQSGAQPMNHDGTGHDRHSRTVSVRPLFQPAKSSSDSSGSNSSNSTQPLEWTAEILGFCIVDNGPVTDLDDGPINIKRLNGIRTYKGTFHFNTFSKDSDRKALKQEKDDLVAVAEYWDDLEKASKALIAKYPLVAINKDQKCVLVTWKQAEENAIQMQQITRRRRSSSQSHISQSSMASHPTRRSSFIGGDKTSAGRSFEYRGIKCAAPGLFGGAQTYQETVVTESGEFAFSSFAQKDQDLLRNHKAQLQKLHGKYSDVRMQAHMIFKQEHPKIFVDARNRCWLSK